MRICKKFWEPKYRPNGFQEQWDVAVLDNNIFRGRAISDLIPAEVIELTIEQLRTSDMLRDLKSIDGTSIWDQSNLHVVEWPYWEKGELLRNVQDEYKISCNAGTEALAPQMITNIRNVFVGGVVMQNFSSIVTQEQACINGRRVAHHILSLEKHTTPKIHKIDLPSPGIAYFLRVFDAILYSLKLYPVEYTETKLVIIIVILVMIVVIGLSKMAPKVYKISHSLINSGMSYLSSHQVHTRSPFAVFVDKM